jgi:hypothetical protein
MPSRSLFLWLSLRDASDFQFAGGARATASAGKGRRPHPRFCSKRLRFWPEAIMRASQLTRPVPPQAKAFHAVPLLAFRKQGFHPDLTLVQSFLVGQGLLVALDPFHIVGKKGAVDTPPTRTFGTLRFDRADIADYRISAILYFLDPFQEDSDRGPDWHRR